jgi:hypothetical protein
MNFSAMASPFRFHAFMQCFYLLRLFLDKTLFLWEQVYEERCYMSMKRRRVLTLNTANKNIY